MRKGTDPLDTTIERKIIEPFRDAIRAIKKTFEKDRDYFIIPAQDQHGHTEAIRVSVQPGWIRTVAAIINNPRWPFRTPSDFYRWCIYMGVHLLFEVDPDGGTIERQSEVLWRTIRERDRIIEMRKVFDEASNRITQLRAHGFPGEAETMVQDMWKAIDVMNDGEAKRHYIAMFDSRFKCFMPKADKRQLPLDVNFWDTTEGDDDQAD